MSSILTNNGAMIALQTLKGINSNMAKTQSEISTGKSVANAKDNAAIWAISKTMESDVAGFTAISENLRLGQSTVAVAQEGAETVTKLLTDMKTKITSAQGKNEADRAKIQTDIQALKDQITAVVVGAQSNGVNLLQNTSKTAGSGSINVLSSLDRSATGVKATNINIEKLDLNTTASNISGTAVATATNGLSGAADATAVTMTGATTAPTTTLVIDATNDVVTAGTGYSIAITGGAGSFATGFNTTDANTISYVARDGDTEADVAKGVAEAFNKHVADFKIANPSLPGLSSVAATVSGSTITFTGSDTASHNFGVAGNSYAAAGNTIGGGLRALSKVDVATSDATAATSLREIEGLITSATDSAAAFGSVAGRLTTQAKFVSSLTDSLKSGIGTLVDADMEETSARLQALQVQQQLGVQSLSIANQAPQSILSLFR